MSVFLDKKIDLLKKINKVGVNGKSIADHYIYKGYSIWSFYQTNIWRDIVRPDFLEEKIRVSESKPKVMLLRLFSFLVTVLSLLIFFIKKPKVIIFSTDVVSGEYNSDRRIELVYKNLKTQNIKFGELIHMRLNRSMVQNLLKRKRPVIYLESLSFLEPIVKKLFRINAFPILDVSQLDLSDFSAGELGLVKHIIRTYSQTANQSIVRIEILSRILKFLRPQMIFTIDDYRYYHEVLLAGRVTGLKTCSFQHGRFNEYVVGPRYLEINTQYCLTPDLYITWNEYWQNRLFYLSRVFLERKNSVIVGGKPSKSDSKFIGPGKDDNLITVLIPFEQDTDKTVIVKYIKELLLKPKVRVVLKLRKDLSFESQIKAMGVGGFQNNSNLISIFNQDDLPLEVVDIIAGTYSTFLYEMISAGKPVIIFQTDMTQADDLVKDGFAVPMSLDDLKTSDLNELIDVPIDKLKKSSQKMAIIDDISLIIAKIIN